MNVNAIRRGLAELLVDIGWEAKHYVPDSLADLPAAVVNPPVNVEYNTSLGLASVTIPVSLAVSLNDAQDAQDRLDAAVSLDDEDSPVSVLSAAPACAAWRSVRVLRADNWRKATDGGHQVLACDITVEVLTRKAATT